MHTFAPNGTFVPYKDCRELGEPIEILEGEHITWDNNTPPVEGDVYVRTGGILTVTCVVEMPPNSTVYVEKGAYLEIIGTDPAIGAAGFVLARPCNSDEPINSWNGIRVFGNQAVRHKDVIDFNNLNTSKLGVGPDPGVVTLLNGIIQGAKIGISTKGPLISRLSSSEWGGIIQAEFSTFFNNKKSVEFMSYQFENISKFENCTFNSRKAQELQLTPEVGVSMWGTKGITFENCVFTNISDFGIKSIDASYSITKGCRFSGMQSGIYATSTLGKGSTIIIDGVEKENQFSNCHNSGITATGIDVLDISLNKFKGNQNGVVISGESLYNIFENNFECHHTDINIISSGGEDFTNSISCNNHRGTSTNSILVVSDNRGVDIDFEKFRGTNGINMNSPFAVSIFPGSLSDQGALNNPRENDFEPDQSDILVNNIFSYAPSAQGRWFDRNANHFSYFYHKDHYYPDPLFPECDYKGLTLGHGCQRNNNYSNRTDINYSEDLKGLCPLKPDIIIDPFLICNNSECFQTLSNSLQTAKNQIDGGNSELLNTTLNYTGGSETLSELNSGSPYLSDDVLAAVLENMTLETGEKETLLQANAPLNPGIILYAGYYLDENFVANIEAIRITQPTSAREEVESEIKSLLRQRNVTKRFLIEEWIKTKNEEAINSLFNTTLFEADKIDLLAAMIRLNNYDNAQTMITSMYASSDQNVKDFAAIQQINLNWLSNDEYQPTEIELTNLSNIAGKLSAVSGSAQSLEFFLAEKQFEVPLPEGTELPPCIGNNDPTEDPLRSQKQFKSNIKLESNIETGVPQEIKIIPNPAKDEFSILLGNEFKNQIKIFNAFGKEIYQRVLNGQNEIQIQTMNGNPFIL